jgi:parallel beta-helix repeat protein
MKPGPKQLTRLLTVAVIIILTVSLTPSGVGLLREAQITIHADGSVEGTDKIQVNGNVYTLTSDLSGSAGNGACFVAIEKDHITLDGGGHKIQGEGTGVAVTLYGRTNVVVKNLVIDNFGVGLELKSDYNADTQTETDAASNQILNNQITTVYDGVSLQGANNNQIKQNKITSPSTAAGIGIRVSHGNTVVDNQLFGGGIDLYNHTGGSFSGNTIDGKAIVILEDESNQVVDGAGQALLYNCKEITVRNIPDVGLDVAVGFFGTGNSKIENCRGNIVLENSNDNVLTQNQANSIKLWQSHQNQIFQNTLSSSSEYGIRLEFSTYNVVESNTVSAANNVGISSVSEANSILRNMVFNSKIGIELSYYKGTIGTPGPSPKWCSTNNIVSGNNITKCSIGISLDGADENEVFANDIEANAEVGVKIFLADGNAFYHNNFVENAQDVFEEHTYFERGNGRYTTYFSANNTWDNNKEGNFWSNYTGTDANGDGIGDTPYQVFENHQDNYPLMVQHINPDTEPPTQPPSTQPDNNSTANQDFPTTTILLIVTIIAAGTCVTWLFFFRKPKPKRKGNAEQQS